MFFGLDAQFFAWLWRSSWQAAVLVLLVLMAHWAFGKRLSPAWKYNLWLLVALRLMLPFSPESVVSVFNWAGPKTIVGLKSALAPTPEGAIGASPSSPTDSLTLAPFQNKSAETSAMVPELREAQSPTPPTLPGSHLSVPDTISRNWVRIWPWVWLAGALFLFSRLLGQNVRFAARLRRSKPVTDPAVLELLEQCRDALGSRWERTASQFVIGHRRCQLPVIETNLVKSPALYGCLRPRLLLPTGMTTAFTREELRYVFLHELAHLKRLDPIVNWLMTVLHTLHWFNPFIWLACHRMRADRELACDALVLSKAPDGENRAYGQAILKLLESLVQPAAMPGLVGILEDKRQMERRIKSIAHFKKPSKWSALATFLLVGLGWATLTDGRTKTAAEQQELSATPASRVDQAFQAFLKGERTELERIGELVSVPTPPVATNLIELAGRHELTSLTNAFATLLTEQMLRHSKDESLPVPWSLWPILEDIVGVSTQMQRWNPKLAILVANTILTRVPSNSVLLVENNAGRSLVTAFKETQPAPFFLIGLDRLADVMYVRHLRLALTNELAPLSDESHQKGFHDYFDDVRKRLAENRLKPGEVAQWSNEGRLSISGRVAVMQINGIHARTIFDQNPALPFYLAASEPPERLFPHLIPEGPILRINREPLTELKAAVLESDRDFWVRFAKRLIGGTIGPQTSIAELCDWIEVVHVERLGQGFRGEADYLDDLEAQKTLSNLRGAVAQIYQWRETNASGPAAERLHGEADFAFKQALALGPGNTNLVRLFTNFLSQTGRELESKRVADTHQEFLQSLTQDRRDAFHEPQGRASLSQRAATERAPKIRLAGTDSPYQGPVPVAADREKKSLLFRVADEETGQGLGGAKLAARFWHNWKVDANDSLVTDSDGRCVVALPDVELSRLDIAVVADGHVHKFATWRPAENDPIPAEYTLRLPRGTSIGGVVANEEGQPIQWARIKVNFVGPDDRVHRRTQREHLGFVEDVHFETTDATGKWSCTHVAQNYRYLTFRMSHSDYSDAVFSTDANDQGWTGFASLAMKDLWAGTAKMSMARGVPLPGVVSDSAGKPIENASVLLGTTFIDSNAPKATSGPDGTFVFRNRQPGPATLSVAAKGFAPDRKTVNVSQGMEPIRFRLAPGGILKGRVVDPENKPVADAYVALEIWRERNTLEWKAFTDAEGRFVWDSAPTDQAYYFISKKGLGELREKLLVADGEEQLITLGFPQTQNITVPKSGLKPPARKLTVKAIEAENGKPVAGAMLTYLSFPPNEEKFFTREDGIGTVPVPKLDNRTAVFLVFVQHADFAPRAIFSVSANGNVRETLPEDSTIKLHRGITIGGVVQDDKGKPIPQVRVSLNGSNGGGYRIGSGEIRTEDYSDFRTTETNGVAVTDANGRWQFAHFPDDLRSVLVELVRPDGSRTSFATEGAVFGPLFAAQPISREALFRNQAVFVLPEGITVRGMVVDPANAPVAGARVTEAYGYGNIKAVGTVATDAQGRFELRNRGKRELILTVESDAHATKSTVVQVEPSLSEVRIQLEPKRPLLGRVLDEHGAPIRDATIKPPSYENRGMVLNWAGKSDAGGRFRWETAPYAPVVLDVLRDGYPPKRVKLTAGEPEAMITLRKENADHVTFTGKVVDAQTRRPLDEFTVSIDYQGSNPPGTVGKGAKGAFTHRVNLSDFKVGIVTTYGIRVEAEGYDPRSSRQFDFAEGDISAEFALEKGQSIAGVVALPNGRPAAEARVMLHVGQRGGFPGFPNMRNWMYGGNDGRFVTTGADGKFSYARDPEAKRVVVSHESGYAEVTVQELQASPEVRLKPWGRVEGIFRIGRVPGPNQSLNLRTLLWHPDISIHLTLQAVTDSEGRFAFDYVPAGEYQLDRIFSSGRPGPITTSHQMPIEVRPGETLKIAYGGTGRPVIGRIRVSPPGAQADWGTTDQVLELKQRDVPRPKAEDFASPERFREADQAHFASDAVKQLNRNKRTYVLKFDNDGSFRAEDVAPGTYRLVVRVLAPSNDPGDFRDPGSSLELGAIRQEIVVPEIPGGRSDEPLDLGTFEMKLTQPSRRAGADTNPQ